MQYDQTTLMLFGIIIFMIITLFLIILPFHRRYCYVIFFLKQYLTILAECVGESDIFYDAAYNLRSPFKLAFKYKEDDITLEKCVYDVEFLQDTIGVINGSKKVIYKGEE